MTFSATPPHLKNILRPAHLIEHLSKFSRLISDRAASTKHDILVKLFLKVFQKSVWLMTRKFSNEFKFNEIDVLMIYKINSEHR